MTGVGGMPRKVFYGVDYDESYDVDEDYDYEYGDDYDYEVEQNGEFLPSLCLLSKGKLLDA